MGKYLNDPSITELLELAADDRIIVVKPNGKIYYTEWATLSSLLGGEEWLTYSRHLTPAEVIDLTANPIVAVLGQAGKVCVVRHLFIHYNNDGTTNYSSGRVGLKYNDLAFPGTGAIGHVITGSSNPLYQYYPSPPPTNAFAPYDGLDLIINHPVAFTPGGGDRSVDVYFEYMFIDNPIA